MSAVVRSVTVAVWLLVTTSVQFAVANDENQPPNILFLLIDDLGWSDIGYNGAADISTPFVDNLATQESLILHNSYVQHICTPTRAALMSGRYPFRLGMQHHVIEGGDTFGLPLKINITDDNGTITQQNVKVKTLPEILNNHGYRTGLVGKWHLGHCKDEYLPTNRGFETFFGMLLGEGDHFNHTYTEYGHFGFDLRNNTDPVKAIGDYSTYLFGNTTQGLLNQYANDRQTDHDVRPFFLEFAFQVVHGPLEAPIEWIDAYADDERLQHEPKRLIRAAMASAMDSVINQLITTLKEKDLWNNTLVIFQSDNGAPTWRGGDNSPLRGCKASLYEGGVRTPAFITGGALKDDRKGKRMHGLMHVTDWLATLIDVAQITDESSYIETTDSISQWNNIQNGGDSVREEIIHNVDPLNCTSNNNICGGIRRGKWKLVIGSEVTSFNPVMFGWPSLYEVDDSMNNASVRCNGHAPPPIPNPKACPWNGKGCLFDISNDPCEYHDLSLQEPEIYNDLMSRLLIANTSQAIPLKLTHPVDSEGSNPENMDQDFWGPWLPDDNDTDTTITSDTIVIVTNKDSISKF